MGLFIRWNACEQPDCIANGGAGGLVAWCLKDTPQDIYEVSNENDYKNCININNQIPPYLFISQGNGVTGFILRPTIDKTLPKIRYFVSKSMCKKGLKVQIKTCEDPKDCFCFDCQI